MSNPINPAEFVNESDEFCPSLSVATDTKLLKKIEGDVDESAVREILRSHGSFILNLEAATKEQLITEIDGHREISKVARQTHELPRETLLSMYKHIVEMEIEVITETKNNAK